jgi:hypothetical protein
MHGLHHSSSFQASMTSPTIDSSDTTHNRHAIDETSLNRSNVCLADVSLLDVSQETESDRFNKYIVNAVANAVDYESNQSTFARPSGLLGEDGHADGEFDNARRPNDLKAGSDSVKNNLVVQSCSPDFIKSCDALMTEMPGLSCASPIFERKISDQSTADVCAGGVVLCCFDEAGMPLLSLAVGTALLPRAQLGLVAAVYTSCRFAGFDLCGFTTQDAAIAYR